jgi:hypothetical protein
VNHGIGDTIVQTTRRAVHSDMLAAVEPYVTKAGASKFILSLRGCCARCGESFTQTTSRTPSHWLTRTCEPHRRRR